MTVRLHPDLMRDPDRIAARSEAAAGLRRAAARLEQPHTWTQGALARDARAQPVGYADPNAVRWCLTGAIRKEMHDESIAAGVIANRAILAAIQSDDIAHYNDRATSVMQVVAVARIAARSLEEDD